MPNGGGALSQASALRSESCRLTPAPRHTEQPAAGDVPRTVPLEDPLRGGVGSSAHWHATGASRSRKPFRLRQGLLDDGFGGRGIGPEGDWVEEVAGVAV